MSKHLQRDLDALERDLLAMSSLAEEAISKACRALREARVDLAREVLAAEPQIDAREVQIEEDCLKIFALHQPVAVDLRRTATVLKINNDLERIADLAANVAELVIQLARHPDFAVPENLDQMSQLSIAMVNEALNAFVQQDTQAAREVCHKDRQVEACNNEVIDELLSVMRSRTDLIEAAMHFVSVCRIIERIADHATNIAEDVIYLIEGEIARHKHHEEPDSNV